MLKVGDKTGCNFENFQRSGNSVVAFGYNRVDLYEINPFTTHLYQTASCTNLVGYDCGWSLPTIIPNSSQIAYVAGPTIRNTKRASHLVVYDLKKSAEMARLPLDMYVFRIQCGRNVIALKEHNRDWWYFSWCGMHLRPEGGRRKGGLGGSGPNLSTSGLVAFQSCNRPKNISITDFAAMINTPHESSRDAKRQRPDSTTSAAAQPPTRAAAAAFGSIDIEPGEELDAITDDGQLVATHSLSGGQRLAIMAAGNMSATRLCGGSRLTIYSTHTRRPVAKFDVPYLAFGLKFSDDSRFLQFYSQESVGVIDLHQKKLFLFKFEGSRLEGCLFLRKCNGDYYLQSHDRNGSFELLKLDLTLESWPLMELDL